MNIFKNLGKTNEKRIFKKIVFCKGPRVEKKTKKPTKVNSILFSTFSLFLRVLSRVARNCVLKICRLCSGRCAREERRGFFEQIVFFVVSIQRRINIVYEW